PLALAECYAAIGLFDKAKEQFAAAVQRKPDDFNTLRIAIDFYVRANETAQAEHFLRQVQTLGSKNAETGRWAREALAVLLAAKGDEQSLQQAFALVGLSNDGLAPSDRGDPRLERARAAVLASQPGQSYQQKAIAMFESLALRQPLTPEDQFLLVQLY